MSLNWIYIRIITSQEHYSSTNTSHFSYIMRDKYVINTPSRPTFLDSCLYSGSKTAGDGTWCTVYVGNLAYKVRTQTHSVTVPTPYHGVLHRSYNSCCEISSYSLPLFVVISRDEPFLSFVSRLLCVGDRGVSEVFYRVDYG